MKLHRILGLVGALLLAARVLGLGFVANFISTPVLTGFKAGIGLVIVLDQVPKLVGLHIEKQGFFSDLLSLLHHLPGTSFITLAVALATFAGPEFRGLPVPEALLSGNHERIRRWRRGQALLRTRARRPDLWAKVQPQLTDLDHRLLFEAETQAAAPAPDEPSAGQGAQPHPSASAHDPEPGS